MTGVGVGNAAPEPDVQTRCSVAYGLTALSAVLVSVGAGIQLPLNVVFGFSVSAVKIANVPLNCPNASVPPMRRAATAAAAALLRALWVTSSCLERGPARSRRA